MPQDTNQNPELNAFFCALVDPLFSWIDYQNVLHVELDPGMVLHKPLPQQAMPVDSLSSVSGKSTPQDSYDYFGDRVVAGINLRSRSNQADVIQRMATSTYRVRLSGYGIRAAYRVPIPALLRVGGSIPVPDKDTWADEGTLANYSGIPIFFARWELWYHVAVPPTRSTPPPPNFAAHIRGDAQLPRVIKAPVTVPEGGPVVPGLNVVGIQSVGGRVGGAGNSR